jgi:hypothetical protein
VVEQLSGRALHLCDLMFDASNPAYAGFGG